MRRRLADLMFERGGLLVLTVLVVYVWLAPTHIVDGDNAEFATLGTIGGGAHPSGYPLYVLWLRATSWLPGSSPVHVASIATVILAAAHVAVLHAACRVWGARPLAATIATGVLAASPFVLRMYTQAEVFALNGLIVALILWLAATNGPLRGAWRATALGLVAGLGLANHLTAVLLAPIGILGVVRAARESSPRAVLHATGALVLGLMPYLYLFIAHESPMSWPRPEGVADLVAIFTRRAYGGAAGFSGSGAEVAVTAQLGLLAETVGRTWLWVLAVVGIVTLGYRFLRTRDGEPRAGWIALAACIVVAGPLLVLRFDVDTRLFGIYIVRRFHILPALLLAPAVAHGLDLVWSALGSRVAVRIPRGLAATLAALGFVAASAPGWPQLAAIHSPALEAGIDDMLHWLPADAIVFAHGDTIYTGSLYAQLAERQRPDVVFVKATAMETPWYRERIEQRTGIVALSPERITSFARGVLATQRPLLVDPALMGLLPGVATYPYGFLLRALPPGTSPPPLADVFALNKTILEGLHLDYPTPSVRDLHAAAMNARYARWWNQLADTLAAAGELEAAAWAQHVAKQLAPMP